jgi:hypothetical protein
VTTSGPSDPAHCLWNGNAPVVPGISVVHYSGKSIAVLKGERHRGSLSCYRPGASIARTCNNHCGCNPRALSNPLQKCEKKQTGFAPSRAWVPKPRPPNSRPPHFVVSPKASYHPSACLWIRGADPLRIQCSMFCQMSADQFDMLMTSKSETIPTTGPFR